MRVFMAIHRRRLRGICNSYFQYSHAPVTPDLDTFCERQLTRLREAGVLRRFSKRGAGGTSRRAAARGHRQRLRLRGLTPRARSSPSG